MPKKASSIEIHLLGPFRIFVDGQAVDERQFTRRKPKQLIKLLALQPHHQLHREQAMELLWPDSDPESAANNLHKTIHLARHALEPSLKSVAESHFVLTQGQQVLLRASGTLWIDADEFELRAAAASKSADVKAYEAARALYEGELLTEDLYEDWTALRREQLRSTHQELLSKLAGFHEARGEHKQAIDLLKELAAGDSSNEETHRQLMRLYALNGNKHQALRQYDSCREILLKEFAVEPEQATRALRQQILSGRLAPVSSSSDVEPRPDSVIDSLAIFPLVNASADPNTEYLSDGITEGIINNLSQLPQLRVTARSTVFRYKGQDIDPQKAGREIGVRAVLTGRVFSRGDVLNIQTELVNVKDGAQLWGEQYERTGSDIFEVQEEIAKEIAAKLRLRLTGEEKGRLSKRYTANTEAYQLYLKGRYHWNKRTLEGFQKGLECFEQAIAIDPGYALAYAGISDCHAFRGDVGIAAVPSKEAFSKAKQAALQALEIDDTLAEAHASLAHANMHCFEWAEAEKAFKRAIDLNTNHAQAHQWYAFYLLFNAQHEQAIAEARRALELDPLSLSAHGDLGLILHYDRQYDQAIEVYEKSLELEPNRFRIFLWLGWAYEQKQMYEEAIASFLKARTGEDSTEALASLGWAYAASGNNDEAERVLHELNERSARHYVSPYQRSLLFLSLGEKDKAFAWLERAYDERAEWMIYLSVDPKFDPVRVDVRFKDLLRRIGFASADEAQGVAAQPAMAVSEALRRAARREAVSSLAILPLVNASVDANAEYLSDGITESIINNLSQLPGLTVMAWNTVFRFKGSRIDPRAAGRDLGVCAVLTGRVLELDDRLVVKAELINVADGSQIWGERYNRRLEDVFVIEEEISREISDKLRLKLTGDEQKRLAKRHTDNIEAYHAYLKGRYYWNKRTDKDVRRGLEYFKQAIDQDPCYALAYAGLADSYIILGTFGISSLSPKDAFPKANEAAVKALEIDDTLAEAHASLAMALAQYDWDWLNAEKEFRRAIELKPAYATAHHWYAFVYLTAMGRLDEAIGEEKRAQELEPLSVIINTNLGTLLYLARQYDEAIDQYRQALEIDANFIIAYWMRGLAFEQKSLFEEAIAEFQKAVALSGGTALPIALLGHAFAISGKKDEALKVLDELNELSKRGYVSAYRIAAIYLGLEEENKAFEWLSRAYEERDAWLTWLKVDPVFDVLRADRRYQELVKLVGLA